MIDHENAPDHALGFPQRCAETLDDLFTTTNPSTRRNQALDIGCAVGGSSFELAVKYPKVVGFDLSTNFIRVANRMRQLRPVMFDLPIEGDICASLKCQHNKSAADIRQITARVNFFVGDACRMKEMMQPGEDGSLPLLKAKAYDAILLGNLLCRLPDPMACLEALPDLLTQIGVILIVTPFTWMEDYTPRDKWLGGYYGDSDKATEDGAEDAAHATKKKKSECWSTDRLQQEMERLGFVRIFLEEMPLVIREHQRKFQYNVSEASGWKRKKGQYASIQK